MTEFVEKKLLPLVMSFALGVLVTPDSRDAEYRYARALAECQQAADTPEQGIVLQHYAEAGRAAADHSNLQESMK